MVNGWDNQAHPPCKGEIVTTHMAVSESMPSPTNNILAIGCKS